MKEQKRLGNKGFSLVELIVVIAIMAILVAVLAPTLLSKIEESREGTDYSALGELKTSVEEAVLGSETVYDLVKADITTGNSVSYEVAFNKDDDCKITAIGGKDGTGDTAGDKLFSAVTKVIPALEFKSDAATEGKVYITITEEGKVSAKIVASTGDATSSAITKKNEDPFEVK